MSERLLGVLLGMLLAVGCAAEAPATGRTPRAGIGGAGGVGGVAGQAGSGGMAGMFGNSPHRPDAGFIDVPVAGGGGCVNLQCQQKTCADGSTTTISGKVFDPAGRNPLYNVVVYVPNEPVLALPQGASCDACDSLYTGNPIAVALTDATGSFKLQLAPHGTDIPLVVQIGKWRRQFVIPTVTECTDNPQADGTLRLPRNQTEGDIPKIAVSTGSADTLECLLRRIGVDASEYVPAGGAGRVHIFQGSARMDDGGGFFGGGGESEIAPNTDPPAPMSPAALWSSVDSMMPYDIVLLSCEGQETLQMNQQALHDYANAGGRVFASHFHYSWFNTGPFSTGNLAIWHPGSNDLDDINGRIITQLPDGMPFPKGVALQEWLTNVGALQNGLLQIQQARHNANVDASHTPSQSWIEAADGEAPGATQYFSFNTPLDAHLQTDGTGYCGRVVFSDLHVGAASQDNPEAPVPTGCTDGALSPQEAALEFMLFDLSSCVTPDDVPPTPPVVE